MEKRLFILFISCLLWAANVSAHAYGVDEIPMVHLQDRNRYVSNPDHILSNEAVATIDRMLRTLEDQKGIETLVVAVEEIDGGDCFDFALQLGKKNGVGKQGENNGLVILLVTGERCIQFVTGYGLEGVLPDAICKRIQTRHMNGPFAQAQWDEGMVAGIRALEQYLQEYQPGSTPPAGQTSAADYYPFLFIGLVVVCCILFAYRQQRKKTRCPHCHKHTLYRSNSYLISNEGHVRKERVIYTCSNCGHTESREEERRNDNSSSFGGPSRGGGPIIFGGGFGGGHRGGGFSGGDFGGGDFGGGGAGSKF